MDNIGETMKIAIDLDNTITASRDSIEFFEILTHLLIAEHKIYILTNREAGTEQDVAIELDYMGIDYSEIIITDDKAQSVKDSKINILFDSNEYFLELDTEITVFRIHRK